MKQSTQDPPAAMQPSAASQQIVDQTIAQIHTLAASLTKRLFQSKAQQPEAVTASAEQLEDWRHIIDACLVTADTLQHQESLPVQERLERSSGLLEKLQRLEHTTEHWKTILLDQYRRLMHEATAAEQELTQLRHHRSSVLHWRQQSARRRSLLATQAAARSGMQRLTQLYPNVQELLLRSQTVPTEIQRQYNDLCRQIQTSVIDPDVGAHALDLPAMRLQAATLINHYPLLGLLDTSTAETDTIVIQAEEITGLHRKALLQDLADGGSTQLQYELLVRRHDKLAASEPSRLRLFAHRHWQAILSETDRQRDWLAMRIASVRSGAGRLTV